MKFHNFGPDPPPQSCETSISFFYSMTKNHYVQKKRKILPWKPEKTLKKKSIFSWKSFKFSKYIGQGVPLPPLQKNFIADLDKNMKKKKKSCENGMTPPPVVKIHNFQSQ